MLPSTAPPKPPTGQGRKLLVRHCTRTMTTVNCSDGHAYYRQLQRVRSDTIRSGGPTRSPADVSVPRQRCDAAPVFPLITLINCSARHAIRGRPCFTPRPEHGHLWRVELEMAGAAGSSACSRCCTRAPWRSGPRRCEPRRVPRPCAMPIPAALGPSAQRLVAPRRDPLDPPHSRWF